MGSVSRLAGAILAETQGAYYLVGDLKQPCDFEKEGFVNPGAIKPLEKAFVKLEHTRDIILKSPVLQMDLEGEELPRILAQRFVISRNGSVSDRLWSLILDSSEHKIRGGALDAKWLGNMPNEVWEVVRESILKCK